jgi:hypothetical protein
VGTALEWSMDSVFLRETQGWYRAHLRRHQRGRSIEDWEAGAGGILFGH